MDDSGHPDRAGPISIAPSSSILGNYIVDKMLDWDRRDGLEHSRVKMVALKVPRKCQNP